MAITITMSATFETVEYDDHDDGPLYGGGYTSPTNPWGGFKYNLPDGCHGEAAEAWMAENVETVTFDSIEEAAQFVADFPGGVWQYSQGTPSTDAAGVETTVTLIVDGHRDAVFALARTIEDERDRRLAERAARHRS
jgi:hypothetical protein